MLGRAELDIAVVGSVPTAIALSAPLSLAVEAIWVAMECFEAEALL